MLGALLSSLDFARTAFFESLCAGQFPSDAALPRSMSLVRDCTWGGSPVVGGCGKSIVGCFYYHSGQCRLENYPLDARGGWHLFSFGLV